MQELTAAPPAPDREPTPHAYQRPAYKRYVLVALTAVLTFNYVDRCLVTLLLQPIKEDLHLTDTQLGLLTGIAFGLFYATLGVPIARQADRGNRTNITSLAIGLWGVTVMASVLVSNFAQLLLARIAAAIGEAGCMPPTYSLVGDYFPTSGARARAMAFYMLGNPLAVLIGFMAGGWLNELYGWRMTFFLMGIPGIVLALLIKLTVTEPRTQTPHPEPRRGRPNPQPKLAEVLRSLWNRRSSRNLVIGFILYSTLSQGLLPWYAAFLMRSHRMGAAELGLWFGLIVSITGVFGNLLGGHVAGGPLAHNERKQVRVSALVLSSSVPCFALFLLLPAKQEALLALIPLVVVFNCFLGPTYALLQRVVPEDMRATTLAVVMLLGNLIGMGVGPEIVGLLSDGLAPRLGTDSLRYSMLAMSLVAFWAAYHFWQVGYTVEEDLSALTPATPAQ